MSHSLGKVYLVGAGPGAADLITVRGARLLEQAEIVFHDALVEPEMLALCPQALHIAVGKRCGRLSTSQRFINKRLVDAAHQYAIVVRLKGGDPMLFGRADEEITELENAGISVEVVPGITAALAGAASLKRSLTLRGVARSVAFVTMAQAHDEHSSIEQGFATPLSNPLADTMVYYMSRKDVIRIAQDLIARGKSKNTPVHLLEAVSTGREKLNSLTLGTLAKFNTEALSTNGDVSWYINNTPLLMMVGEALRQKLSSNIHLQQLKRA